jgi:hypothetical protein
MLTLAQVFYRSVLLLAIFAPAAPAQDRPADVRRPKKLISVGWDLFSDTKWIREHLAEMETRPFNGIVLNAVGRRDDGKEQPLRVAFSREPWKYEWFAGAEADLRACRFQRFTDNFVLVGAMPHGDAPFTGKIGEVLVYVAILAPARQQALAANLMEKWGIK